MSRAWHFRRKTRAAFLVALVSALTVEHDGRVAYAEPVFHALPGGIHVSGAETLPAGEANVEVMSGGGYRGGLLAPDHRILRVGAKLSAAFGVIDMLSVGVSLDGYYDRHRGFAGGCGASCEDGYTGAPHVFARVVRPVAGFSVGGQAEIWVPGDVAPSFKVAATSIDLRGVVATDVGPARLTLDAGFRFDNSANSIDDAQLLTVADRVSYGVSNYHAVVGGVRATMPVHPSVDVAVETSLVAFVGAAPEGSADLESGRWIGRFGVSAATRVSRWTVVAFAEAVKGPRVLTSQVMADNIPLVPYEPTIAGGVGLSTSFGGTKKVPRVLGCWDTPAGCAAEEQPLSAEIAGTILDENAQPLAGATVTITAATGGEVVIATTNADGTFTATVKLGRRLSTPAQAGPKVVEQIDHTKFDVRAEVDGREVKRVTVVAAKPGRVEAPSLTLDPVLPVGQIKGVVRSQRGAPIADATVTVTPGDQQGATLADGSFSIDLAPGAYTITVRAPGFREQQLAVTIEANGVALKEFVLRP